MKVVTSAQMKNIDTVTIDTFGVPSLVLMERAGESVADRIEELFAKKNLVVIAGSGNNGGDGIVVARVLRNRGWEVRILIVSKERNLSPDCRSQYRIAREMGMEVAFRERIHGADLKDSIVIDAVFGTGLNKPIKGPLIRVISMINRSGSPVVSVDIPSGISSDTGQVMGKAVRSDYTVTFGLPKIGHFLYPGAECKGKLFVEDIGFPAQLVSSDGLNYNLPDPDYVRGCVIRRSPNSHKGTYGHVLVIAGSEGKTGAALLASRATMRSGAGAVTLGVPDTLIHVFQANVLEEMTMALPSGNRGTISMNAVSGAIDFINDRASVVLLGPGIGVNSEVQKFVREIVLHTEKPLLIDADGLNNIAGETGILRKATAEVVITPHPGEMKRLLPAANRGLNAEEISKKRVEIAESFAQRFRVICVLKGAPTIIAAPDGAVFINSTGNAGMATAGSGDVLSGIIAAFMAQDFNAMNAAVCGVYLHGLAGDIARDTMGEYSLVAGDIVEHLPDAFGSLEINGSGS